MDKGYESSYTMWYFPDNFFFLLSVSVAWGKKKLVGVSHGMCVVHVTDREVGVLPALCDL